MATTKSGFHYLGIGCVVAAILLVVGGAVVTFVTYRWGKGIEAELKDPDSRRGKVLEILGAETLPEGYHAMVGFRIPMLLETAILTDREPEPDEELPELGERGLLYFALRDFGRDRQDLDDFFTGRSDDTAVLERHRINVDLGDRVANGTFEGAVGPIDWVTHHGNLDTGRSRGRHEGLVTLLRIHCPDDAYNRMAMWFGPEAAERSEEDDNGNGSAAPSGSPVGSVADPAGIEAFAAHFRFCPE